MESEPKPTAKPAARSKGQPTQIVPGFEILGLLGRGGMGAVYRARKLNIGKEVALKVLLPSLAEDPVTAARFDREVRALARLRHVGLVNVIDAGEAPPYRYMVLDLVEGSDLQRMVEESGPLRPSLVESIAVQVLEALAYVHELGMVHRDLKPANLILDPQQHVRLCDLGLVRIVDESSQLTQALMLGTPEYVSPEQVRGESDLDIRSDLYSLGVTLYYLLAGRPPFVADTPMATAQLQVSARAVPIEKIIPAVPPGLGRLVQALMEKRPSKRPADPHAALELLRSPVAQSRRAWKVATLVAPAVLGFSLFGGLRLFGEGGDANPGPAQPTSTAPVGTAVVLGAQERAQLEEQYQLTAQEISDLEALGKNLSGQPRVEFEANMKKIREKLDRIERRLNVPR
jgi:serine/threonine protein kinase